MCKHKNQSGFGVIEVILVILLLAAVGIAGYYVYRPHTSQVAQPGTIDVKELGIKLTFSDIRGWTEALKSESSPRAEFDYNGYGSGRITQYTSASEDQTNNPKRQIGRYYYVLSRTPCPCSQVGEQAYDKLNTAFSTAIAD